MLENNDAEEIVEAILRKKFDMEKAGEKPRVILMGPKTCSLIESDWLESIKELPWGDSLAFEAEKKIERGQNVFLGEGSMFGLWVIRVNTIEGFRIF